MNTTQRPPTDRGLWIDATLMSLAVLSVAVALGTAIRPTWPRYAPIPLHVASSASPELTIRMDRQQRVMMDGQELADAVELSQRLAERKGAGPHASASIQVADDVLFASMLFVLQTLQQRGIDCQLFSHSP